jgi:hypothetical protein
LDDGVLNYVPAVSRHRIKGSLRIKGIQAHIERLDLRCKVRGLQQEIKKFPGEVQCLAERGHINEAWCTAILNTDSKGNGVEKGRLGRVSPRPIYQCTLKERLTLIPQVLKGCSNEFLRNVWSHAGGRGVFDATRLISGSA